MKKIASVLMALALMAVMAGCSAGNESGETETDVNTQSAETADTNETAGQTEPVTETAETEAEKQETGDTEPEAEETEAYEVTYTSATAYTNSIGTVWTQVIIEITNTGSVPLYLSAGSYDLEDDAGNLVATEDLVSAYPQVVQPGEKGYMYNETTCDKATDGMALTVVPHVDAEKATVESIILPVSDIDITDAEYGGLSIMGRVENTTEEEQSLIYIVCVLYDADGNPREVDFTIPDNIAAGDKVGFEAASMSPPDGFTADMVAKYTVYAYPFQFQL